ncbi:NF-kappa-B inhibitor zeta I-kappa-B-zeta [Larimichthys crocea]|uniref:NF-kappa-B inhibitor zeta I-kappa-B-zeta n=1 Tax=Larimichthys crocea TaxID=215358 RepID=A0A6G0HGW5_LARCR|nr:NF-kappa-B inhibitor zeta [Larimichthys crocea]XP_010741845.2 NF-kappa-B inhibitor zeta [Larimichthys crocea]XP_027147240.1 NF-kappa-B inhibitor zeta [Larimichthys crocea]KAE8278271.1 NF-kappa-B inhibitor zeta I-kappa-B-zeta [Larimichthys crocea]
MLDPRGNETRGSMSAGTDFINDTVIDNRPAEYFQTIHKKNTVKELLMMRRQKCSDNILEHKFKSPKSEVFPSDLSPHLFDPPTPVHFSNMDQSPPENGHITQQQMQHPMYPTAEVKLTLFHWQIQRETQRMEGVSQEKLNMQDGDGDTILHIAVAKGRRALAYVLATQMSRCGSLDVKEHNGQTALQIAAATNQHLIVHDLLEHGAQINTRDLWGRSPLHVCAEKGHLLSLQSIWKTLMRTGQPIDIEMFNYEGLTALHAAVMSHNAVVKELRTLENPCSYMTMELGQRRQMHFECIKILLHMGACFGTKDLKSGHTCLHMASEEANVELLNLFLDQSSSLSFINVKTFSGNTALHIVSSLQNHKTQVEAVKLLMRNGADPGTRNFENELPCHLVPGGPVGDKVRRVLKGKYVHA